MSLHPMPAQAGPPWSKIGPAFCSPIYSLFHFGAPQSQNSFINPHLLPLPAGRQQGDDRRLKDVQPAWLWPKPCWHFCLAPLPLPLPSPPPPKTITITDPPPPAQSFALLPTITIASHPVIRPSQPTPPPLFHSFALLARSIRLWPANLACSVSPQPLNFIHVHPVKTCSHHTTSRPLQMPPPRPSWAIQLKKGRQSLRESRAPPCSTQQLPM
jgi:hypothetical protein